MSLCCLRDNSKVPSDFEQECPNLYKKLTGETLGELTDGNDALFVWPPVTGDDSNPDFNKDDYVVTHRSGSDWTGNLMGFLGLGDERLAINSRFSETKDNGDDFFLQYMLQRALGFSAIDLQVELDQDSPFYRILELLFPLFLRSALKKGMYKVYVRKQFDDSHVRGVIDIPRFIRSDLPFTGNISYNTREHSTDNHVTELVRHTVESILSEGWVASALLKRDINCRRAIQAVRNATPGYRRQDRNKAVAYNLKHPVRSGYFRPYRDLQRLCIAILRDKRASVLGKDEHKVCGILFNGASLWEEYLNSLFKESALDVLHPNNRTGDDRQYFFQGRTGKIFPDFIVPKSDPIIILDAKYKPSQNVAKDGGDWKQILSYMFRFDTKFGALLYPYGKKFDKGEPVQVYRLLRGVGPNAKARDNVGVVKLGLEIPTACKDQEDFDNKMKDCEKKFVSNLDGYCFSEV